MSRQFQFFQGAQGTQIHAGADFRTIYGDFHQHQISVQNSESTFWFHSEPNVESMKFPAHHRVGIQALSQAISHGAMHDSADRDPPPRCHPGTREKATKDIVRWIEESDPSSTVLWVNGRAGVGKSALMQMIAEMDGIYFGGCFFFRRGTAGCNVKDHLFSTLAYQLAMNVPGMLEHIDRAMTQDFSLPKKSIAVQLKQLITEPFKLLPPLPALFIIIIDGLDECEDLDSQRAILSLIAQVAVDFDIAIRFIVASRPEYQICDMFDKEPLFSRTRRLVLDDELEYDSNADIKRYLQEKLREIHARNRDIMSNFRSPWPCVHQLDELVSRASGQFIYAATVIKFVGSDTDFRTPEHRLEIILKGGPTKASAFSELDRLYTQILSLHPDSEVLVHTLGVVLVLGTLVSPSHEYANSPDVIAAITGFGEGKLVLRALQSVMEVRTEPVFDDANDNKPNGTNIQWVKLSHRSFHDFLTDKARSGPYFINRMLFDGRVFCRILELATISIKELKIYKRSICKHYSGVVESSMNIQALAYLQ
jgi:hypothetical protein